MLKQLCLFLIMLPVSVLAQTGDTVFTVKAKNTAITLSPETNVLYTGITKRLILQIPEGVEIDTITFTEGRVMRTDSVLSLKSIKGKTALLKIYTRSTDGKRKLSLLKEFSVQKFQHPKPNLDGVDNDSVIHRMRVVVQGYLSVPLRSEPELKRISYPILSYEYYDTQKNDTLPGRGNRLTYTMRDRIDEKQDGSIIEIRNITYLNGMDTFTILQPLRVVLIDDKINKF